jgi:3-oxoacyl-[acyl-carrier-protein] synthase III
MRASITGVGHFVPEKRLTNQDLEKIVDTNDEWITTRTGIKERRILDADKGTSHMGVRAARHALERAGVGPEEIDLIIVATVTPDMLVPSTAAFVQEELGASRCWGFDLNGGCTGFLCALATGAQFIESGRRQNVLVIGADKMSAIIDYEDRNTCVIFGDGGGAALLQPSPDGETGILDYELRLDGDGAKYLYMTGGGSLHPPTHETVDQKMHYVHQDGRTVFKQAIGGMSDVSGRLLERNGVPMDAVKLLIPHQANLRIIDSVAKKLNLKPEQVMVNIQKYGNTTAATIPMAMSEAWAEGMMDPGDPIILSAFGAGFTWGSLLLTWTMAR